jgi:hypothetical protein
LSTSNGGKGWGSDEKKQIAPKGAVGDGKGTRQTREDVKRMFTKKAQISCGRNEMLIKLGVISRL